MPAFAFRVALPTGKIVRGKLDAASAAAASRALADRGMLVVDIRVLTRRKHSKRVSRLELSVLFRSVASLVTSGVPLERAFATAEGLTGKTLTGCVVHIRTALREGSTLADALSGAPTVIPPAVIGVVAAGERGSRLDAALDEVADQLERDAELLSRLRSALAYPMVILVTGIVSAGVLVTVVIPKFAELLQDLGQELPPVTRVLVGATDLVARYWLPIGLGTIAGVTLLAWWLKSANGRLVASRTLLTLPLVGRVRHALASARVCSSLAGMLAAGMPLLAALDAATPSAGDPEIAARLREARDGVARGERMANSLRETSAVNETALQLLAVGETTGEMVSMVRRASELSSQEAERTLKTLTNLLEPLLVILLGGLIAFVAAALLQAVYSVRPGVG